jgi:dihydrodipicolinate synthase/N-acetylneuraminate lyase
MKSAQGCPAELREALNSPIPSLRTPFTSEGSVDLDGLRSQIDFVIAGGARTVMMTWGDSLLSVMTDDEVAGVAKVIVEHTAGRAKVIVADEYGCPLRRILR